MNSFVERDLTYFVSDLSIRADKFAVVLDETDAQNIVRTSIRRLDQIVSYPRLLILNNPGKSVVLPEDVDTVAMVKFSNSSFDMFTKEFGLIPLVARQMPLGSMEGATEFLLLKGNINMLSRQFKFAPDWEFYPPNLVLNAEYNAVVVEYLPFLDGDLDSWVLNSIETTFILSRSEALFHQRNAEALSGASYLGIGTEYGSVLTYWSEKLKAIDDEMVKAGVITYMG